MSIKASWKHFWLGVTDKVGLVGAWITALCCLGVPWLVWLFAAMGVGFLINDRILFPILIIFLLITLVGLYLDFRKHARPAAFLIGVASTLLTFIFLVVHFYPFLVGVGLTGLLAAVVLNMSYKHRRR